MTHDVEDAMRPVAIVTDSSACIPPALARRLAISVLPLTVHLGDDTVADGPSLSASKVYDALAHGGPVKSSPPSTGAYLVAIEEAKASAVVVITPAAEFTTMHHNALLAADLAHCTAEVVDSRTAAAAQGLVALVAAEAARAGQPLADVVAEAERAAARVDLVACLSDLGPIRASGRVPSPALDVPERQRVRAVFRLRDGSVESLAAPSSTSAALRRIRREWERGGGPSARRCAIFHANREAEARTLAEMIGRADFVAEFSAAMGIHTGPWVTGLSWLT